MKILVAEGIELIGGVSPEFGGILREDALQFVASLHRKFNPRRKELLRLRADKQARIDQGELPHFLSETLEIRSSEWRIAQVPHDLQDRRVEITGPAGDRKMVINALNSSARLFMADFEDANSPTWENTVGGQINLRDAVNRTISYTAPGGKAYALNERVAVLIPRPRGWHMEEKHMLVDGEPVSASLFDFGLYFYHNTAKLLENGSGPYFYLPKLESHLEARLWNEVFRHAQFEMGFPQRTIKATVLIETILAAFEMDEILFELRDHVAALNCGRWDYIFSYIKKLRNQPDVILPDRGSVTMTVPFMKAYTLLAIQTCHKRGAHCIGGMAAQIPIKNDPAANEAALEKVRLDKEREAGNGHDGSWVEHPGLVPVAMEVFDRLMPAPNQVDKLLNLNITERELLEVPNGAITEAGVRTNINVGIQYLAAWLCGNGAVPINNLMEDAATAEISRAQLWQWIRHPKGILEDGRKVTLELYRELLEEELASIRQAVSEEKYAAGKFPLASDLFTRMIESAQFGDFLTLPGYDYLD